MRIAVVGAGFSGTMVTCHLLRRGIDVLLFDRRGLFGPGLAYGAAGPAHLLNVPAGNMSAWPHLPEDFLNWGLRLGKPWTRGTFAPRMEYGRYLRDVLNEAHSSSSAALVRVAGEVHSCRPTPNGQVLLEWNDQRSSAMLPPIETLDGVVLALGNPPPAELRALRALPKSLYAPDPWEEGASDTASASDTVLLIGTGLTMIDVAMTLAVREHRGPIIAVSRRGLLPQPHRAHPRPPSYTPPSGVETWARDCISLFRNVRAEVERAHRRGVDWRDVINSLRKTTPGLWASLPTEEKRRFIMHVRPYWEVIRHRTPPSVDGRLQEMIMAGQLRVLAGRIGSVDVEPGDSSPGACVKIQPRGLEHHVVVRVTKIINCTGPRSDFGRGTSQEGLVKSLLEQGLTSPDELGLGLKTAPDGRLIGDSSRAAPGIWHIGPLARGLAWEATAVPELREQAASVARGVAEEALARGARSIP